MRFPTIKAVARELIAIHQDLPWSSMQNEGTDDPPVGDVRLQVYESGAWVTHYGDASYDTDHRGFWGASCIAECDTPKTLRETAKDLIDQARDMKAQGE